MIAGNIDFVDDITPPNSDKWKQLKPSKVALTFADSLTDRLFCRHAVPLTPGTVLRRPRFGSDNDHRQVLGQEGQRGENLHLLNHHFLK